MQLYSHDLICGTFFEMAKHDVMQWLDQLDFGQLFQKKFLLGKKLAPNLSRHYATFCLTICSLWISFKRISMKVYNSYTMVTVNCAKISLSGQNGQFGSNLGKNYAIFFVTLTLI